MPPKAAAKAAGKSEKKAKKEVEAEDPNRIPKPDKEAHEKAIEAVQVQIDALIEQQAKINAEIKEHSTGKEEYMARKQELFAQIQAFNTKIDDIRNRKNNINKDIDTRKSEAMEHKKQLSNMKRSLRYETEGDIDDRIEEIDYKIRTETMSLKEEKDLMKEIAELKKSKPQIAKVRQFEEGSKGRPDLSGDLKAQIGDINVELKAYTEGKRKVHDQLNELQKDNKSGVEELTKHYEARNKVREEIQAKKQERDEIRSKYREEEKAFNLQLKAQREEKYKKTMEERAKWKAESDLIKRKKDAENLDQNPRADDIALIEQTIVFCKSLVTVKEEKADEEKKEIEHDLPDGATVMTKKEDRDEFYYLPTANKKKGKSKKSSKSDAAKPIKHNAMTFSLFKDLGFDAPLTTADIPETIEKLEVKLAEFQAEAAEHEKTREERKRQILAGETPGDAAADETEVAAAAEED